MAKEIINKTLTKRDALEAVIFGAFSGNENLEKIGSFIEEGINNDFFEHKFSAVNFSISEKNKGKYKVTCSWI